MTGLSVIIAEDEAVTRMMLRARLERLGHRVVAECENGAQAVLAAKQHQPELAILDIRMPEMDGIEAAKAIINDHPCAIMFLTGFVEDELVEKAGEAGALAYLLKPFRKEDLGPAIEIAMRRFKELQLRNKEVTELTEALETRKLIERAKGILMDRHGLSEDEAFKRIHFQARNQNRKMKDIAMSIITAADLI
jgi:AmiR/NasT family two-component response regulator